MVKDAYKQIAHWATLYCDDTENMSESEQLFNLLVDTARAYEASLAKEDGAVDAKTIRETLLLGLKENLEA